MSLLRKFRRGAEKGAKKKGPTVVVVTCPQCKRGAKLERCMKKWALDSEITEVGIECPYCKHWTHSFYDTPAVREAREELKKVKETPGATPDAIAEAKRHFDAVYACEQEHALAQQQTH